MRTISAVAGYTVKEHLRHKAWLSAALFAVILLTGGVVVSALAQEERRRMLLDLGLAANEGLAVVTMTFLTVHLILREIESRAVFLILSHPVKRWHYLLGRYLGTLGAVAAGLLAMGAAHWLTMLLAGGAPAGPYAAALAFSFAKAAVMGALALLLSLALTSEAAAMSFAGFLWVLGHFTGELAFLAEKAASPVLRALMTFFAHAAPDLARLNARDFWHASPPDLAWAAWGLAYAAAYAGACLALAAQVFEQKEL